MQEIMTDKQLEFIVSLITDRLEVCATMEDVKKALKEIKLMANKDKNKDN